MPIRQVHYTSDFVKAYRKLPLNIQRIADRKDRLFRIDSYHPSLKTHRLHGELSGLWSFWVTRDYRVLFEFMKDNAIFYDIGTHNIYK